LNLLFTPDGWADYRYWADTDKQIFRRLNAVIEDARRSPFEGIGKPEPLKNVLAGFWARRITGEHRLVYAMNTYAFGQALVIAKCRFHYDK
jgi:toxin YoeB